MPRNALCPCLIAIANLILGHCRLVRLRALLCDKHLLGRQPIGQSWAGIGRASKRAFCLQVAVAFQPLALAIMLFAMLASNDQTNQCIKLSGSQQLPAVLRN